MRTDLLGIIDKAQFFFIKRQILCLIPINCAFQTIDSGAKYSVKDPDPYSEYGSGRVNSIRIRICNTVFKKGLIFVWKLPAS